MSSNETSNTPLNANSYHVETAVGSTTAFIRIADAQPYLPVEDHDLLFDAVSRAAALRASLAENWCPADQTQAGVFAEGQQARDRIARSFLRLVIGKAHEKKSKTTLPLGDLIQAGCVSLLRAIDNYAEFTERRSFARYAEVCIDGGLQLEILYHLMRTKRGSKLIDKALNFWRRRNELKEKREREISISEMAEDLDISKTHAHELAQLIQPEILYEGFGDPDVVGAFLSEANSPWRSFSEPAHELLSGDQERKEILVERGLTVIPANQASIVRLHYGFNNAPCLDIPTIAEDLQLEAATVQTYLHYAHTALREVLPLIHSDEIDYAALQKERPRWPKTVLGFLAIAGHSIPPDYRLPVLRSLARHHTAQFDWKTRDRGIIIDLYGLTEIGVSIPVSQTAAKYGVRDTTIYNVEKKLMGQLAEQGAE